MENIITKINDLTNERIALSDELFYIKEEFTRYKNEKEYKIEKIQSLLDRLEELNKKRMENDDKIMKKFENFKEDEI
jgi:chromosome segregation ATPase